MGSAATNIVVVDSSVLINLIHVQALQLLVQLKPWSFVIPLEAPEEFELLTAAMLRVEIGEAACLALARNRGWRLSCDEKKKSLPLTEEWLGQERVLGTQGLVVMMIRRGLLTVDDADAFLPNWSQNRFRIFIQSFQEVLE